ncbi:hypothetical protein B14911_15496 [Bacillus sp. NRRL B-14911]|nr:hypothetical protein B14911_15496 [Bacillus sp. NRRL B-14911]
MIKAKLIPVRGGFFYACSCWKIAPPDICNPFWKIGTDTV